MTSPDSAGVAPQATVVIVTKNRRDDLRRALASVLAPRGVVLEILVFDDASTDDTPEMVQSEFPQARLHAAQVSTGHIVHRNRGVQMSAAPIVVIIDDDAAFEAPDTIATTLGEFDKPCIGAVAIPFINTHEDFVRQCAPDNSRVWVAHKFIGAAHALRRDAFVAVGGYRTELVHFGEEADFCARLLASGYVTRLGLGTPARHFLSPIRNQTWERYYAARAGIVTSYMNQPALLVPPTLAAWTLRELALIAKHGNPMATLRGIAGGYRDIIRHAGKRHALPWRVHQTLRQLKKRGAVPLDEVGNALPLVQ
ncbi:MAG: glycosyltransferase family 2 protein [Tepidisphaeraceae bacterium]